MMREAREQGPESHLDEAQMLLEDMQRPVELRYAGAQAHAMMAIAKMILAKMSKGGDE